MKIFTTADKAFKFAHQVTMMGTVLDFQHTERFGRKLIVLYANPEYPTGDKLISSQQPIEIDNKGTADVKTTDGKVLPLTFNMVRPISAEDIK